MVDLSAVDFEFIRKLVRERSGIVLGDDKRYLIEHRLMPVAERNACRTLAELVVRLRAVAWSDLHRQVVEMMTTNETYFFREDFQLRTFAQEILPEIRARKEREGRKRLRIWSAGCSTGEEPYTIAMLILELPAFQGWEVEIIGTDISQRVLQSARKGVYGDASFRCTDPEYRRRYFTEVEGKFRVDDRVKSLVTISHLNLFDTSRVALIGKMDAIFCRNVIIYFDLPAKKRVVETFFQRLNPEGFLLLGHSESLMNISNAFVLRHFTHDMVYQRPGSAPLEAWRP